MGFRNPFRFTVDKTTGWVLMGDYGPDAGTDQPEPRPAGLRRVQRAHQGRQLRLAVLHPRQRRRTTTTTSRPRSRARSSTATRRSTTRPNNTGLTNLPPAIGASALDGLRRAGPALHADARHRRRPDGRPALPLRPDARLSDRKFPAYYDDKWFVGEWNNGWIKTADLNADGKISKFDNFALGTGYKRPMDIKFGPDGALYVIEWGSGFNGDNADSGIYRIDYVAGDKAPIADGDRRRRRPASRR